MKNRIAEMREHLDLTLQELADRTGLSKTMISRLEKGTQSFNLRTLEVIAEAMECEPQALLVVQSVSRPHGAVLH